MGDGEFKTNGLINVPAAGAVLTVDEWSYTFDDASQDLTFRMDAHATMLGQPALMISADSKRTAVDSFTVEAPTVTKSFAEFTKDFDPFLKQFDQ